MRKSCLFFFLIRVSFELMLNSEKKNLVKRELGVFTFVKTQIQTLKSNIQTKNIHINRAMLSG